MTRYKKSYTSEQLAQLIQLESAHAEYTELRRELRARIESEYRDRIGQLEYKESLLANQAIALGVTKRDVQLATKTMNWDRFKSLLGLAASDVNPASGVPQWRNEEPHVLVADAFTARDGSVAYGPWRMVLEGFGTDDVTLGAVYRDGVEFDVGEFVYQLMPLAEYHRLLGYKG